MIMYYYFYMNNNKKHEHEKDLLRNQQSGLVGCGQVLKCVLAVRFDIVRFREVSL